MHELENTGTGRSHALKSGFVNKHGLCRWYMADTTYVTRCLCANYDGLRHQTVTTVTVKGRLQPRSVSNFETRIAMLTLYCNFFLLS